MQEEVLCACNASRLIRSVQPPSPIFLSQQGTWFYMLMLPTPFGSMSFTGKTSRIESSLTMTKFVIVRLDSISGGFCLLNIGLLFPVLSLGFHRRLNCR